VYVVGVFDGKADFDPTSAIDFHTSFNYYQDCYLVKYLDNGEYEWARTWGNDVDDYAYGVDSDSLENVYVAGVFGNTVDFDPSTGTDNHTSNGERDAFLSKFAPDGSYLWAKTFGGANNNNWQYSDGAADVRVDFSDSIYVTGWFNSTVDFDPGEHLDEITTNGYSDAFVDVFDSSGDHIWARGWGGSGEDFGFGIAVDDLGSAFVCGYFSSAADFDPGIWIDEHISFGSIDAYLMKFLPDGVW